MLTQACYFSMKVLRTDYINWACHSVWNLGANLDTELPDMGTPVSSLALHPEILRCFQCFVHPLLNENSWVLQTPLQLNHWREITNMKRETIQSYNSWFGGNKQSWNATLTYVFMVTCYLVTDWATLTFIWSFGDLINPKSNIDSAFGAVLVFTNLLYLLNAPPFFSPAGKLLLISR